MNSSLIPLGSLLTQTFLTPSNLGFGLGCNRNCAGLVAKGNKEKIHIGLTPNGCIDGI